MTLKLTFDEMNKKLEKHNAEFHFMVNKRMTESQIENNSETNLGYVFEKYKDIVANKKKGAATAVETV